MKNNLEKFYDFISIYNLLIKHCSEKENTYEINIFHINNELHIKFFNKETKKYIFDDTVSCNTQKALMITNTIANEFVLNHKITLSSFRNINSNEILQYYWYSKNNNLKNINDFYFNENNQQMLIYEIANSNIILRIHYYNGINPIIDEIHHIALNKICNSNINQNKKTYQKKSQVKV